ncbi:MAG: ABC transporter ATP-binding protein [Phycisphaerales bacterium]|nr:ABC transporter ATP-binding protein [Phycisphaerales bacterium]
MTPTQNLNPETQNFHLSAIDVTRQFDPPSGPWVLQQASLEASAGETIAIVGPSGSGKSTLLNIIGSLDSATSGSVRLDTIDITSLSPNDAATYRSKNVGFVFQDHHLLPQLTGLENVLLPSLAIQSRDRKVAYQRASDLLERVGVSSRARAFPAELSGGERQRLAIARALINSPQLLLCDEPTGNLDHDNALKVVDLFVELARRQGIIVIMVTHNLELAARFDKCLRLHEGRLQSVGGTSSDPALRGGEEET